MEENGKNRCIPMQFDEEVWEKGGVKKSLALIIQNEKEIRTENILWPKCL